MRLGSRERRPKKLQRKRISGANKCRISILESACIILWFLYLGISRHDETCCLSSKDDLRCYRRRVASIRPLYKQTIMKIMPKVQSDSPLGSPTHQRHSSYIRPAIKSSVRDYLLEIYHNYRTSPRPHDFQLLISVRHRCLEHPVLHRERLSFPISMWEVQAPRLREQDLAGKVAVVT